MSKATASNPLSEAERLIAYKINPHTPKVVGVDIDAETVGGRYVELGELRLEVDEDLRDSIKSDGVIEPIICEMTKWGLLVVDGRRRIINARAAGVEQVRVLVEREGSVEDNEYRAVMLNAHRMQDDPYTEAIKAKRLLEVVNMPKDRVCQAFNWSPLTLKNRLALLQLALPVQKLVRNGKLSPIAAKDLVSLPEDKQLAKAKELVESPEGQTKRARAAKLAAKRDDGDTEERTKPTTTYVKELLATEAAANLDANIVRCMKWFIAEGSHTKIAGMAACINEVAAKKEAAAQERATKRAEKVAAKGNKKKPPPRRLSDVLGLKALKGGKA